LLFVLAEPEDIADLHPGNHSLKPIIEVNLDVGLASGPGPVMHSQYKSIFSGHVKALGSEIDIPRVPGLLAVPSEVIDFTLSQLFQDEWPRHFETRNLVESPAVWMNQRKRFKKMLEGAVSSIDASSQSAWHWMRKWSPSFV
jgi:hypothetical protein